MNTKHVTDTDERKKLKRAARKKAAPKAKTSFGRCTWREQEKSEKTSEGPKQKALINAFCSTIFFFKSGAWEFESVL